MNDRQINMATEWYVNLNEKDRAVIDYLQMFEHQIIVHGIDPNWFRVGNEKLIVMDHDGGSVTFQKLISQMTVKIPDIWIEVDELLPVSLSVFRTRLKADLKRMCRPPRRAVEFLHEKR